MLFLRGWNVLQQQQMSQRKARDICNCSQVLQSVPEPCENDGVSYGSSICSWSRTTIGAEVDHRRSVTHITNVGFYTVGHPLHRNYRWVLSSLYNAAPVSMCLQRFWFCCTKKRNSIHFESPIVGVNVCDRQTFQRGAACTLLCAPSASLTNPQMSLGDAARQKQSSCILELTTYCYSVLKK